MVRWQYLLVIVLMKVKIELDLFVILTSLSVLCVKSVVLEYVMKGQHYSLNVLAHHVNMISAENNVIFNR
jgi:hypothetical protein